MSRIAQDLDETLRRLDLQSAQRLERVVRELLVQAEPPATGQDAGGSLADLAAHAEPMGVLTNAEIDRAIYGG